VWQFNTKLGRHLERHASDLKQKLGRWLSTPHAHIEIGNWVEVRVSFRQAFFLRL
jgi:hypothetical protein